MIPKYIMSGGKLVKILLKTRVSRYLEWKGYFLLIQPLMELTFYKTKKEDSFPKADLKSQKYQSLQKKLSHQTSWACWKKEDAKSSCKSCKTSNKLIQRLTTASKLTSHLALCSKNSVCKKTQSISSATPSASIATRNSLTYPQLKSSEKSNCTWTPWADMEIHHSFIQFTDWEEFLKDSPESVPLMAELSC